jgi:tRNA 2-thiouridine synthesizing protein E
MTQITIAGINLEITDDGYLTDSSVWNKEIAAEIAKEEEIELTDEHFKILEFIRDKVEKDESLTIRSVGKSGIVDIKGFYKLFPGGPLKKATRIAGLAKPSSCV